MAVGAKTGLLDLEKELTCSICTEVLYQPLTLLDCLHTFCGSCLKEWFSWQASQATTAKPNPFTCPSCRASVRDTKPNAGITTLLDMYLQANPSRGRSDQEKEATKSKYNVGDSVLPRISRVKESNHEAEDRRMVEEIRELSLRDVGIRGPRSYERGVRHRIRDGINDGRDETSRQRHRHERGESASGASSRPSTATDAASRARQIEHQSSLRSLLSASDVDSSDLEEEILRQIMDEGILDGIDLNNIDVTREDELSERIADAYRRRHIQRSRSRDDRHESSRDNTTRNQRSGQNRQDRHPSRSPSRPSQSVHSSHPPVSRPHLLEAYPTSRGHRRRTSSESRRQTSPNPSPFSRGTSAETRRQAARSATDLSNRPQSSSNHRARPRDPSSNGRRTTDPDNLQPRGTSRENAVQAPMNPSGRPRETVAHHTSHTPATAVESPRLPVPDVSTPATRTSVPDEPPNLRQNGDARPISRDLDRRSGDSAEARYPFQEPSFSCDRCAKSNIEYELHWNCLHCREGRYNLCLRCYRMGLGCLHWFGFGYAALQRYRVQEQAAGYPPDHPPPHRLEGHRYLRPSLESIQPNCPNSNIKTSSDPVKRLQSGPFCSNCLNYTTECFWKCDMCNEGEWGFCNTCVNQGKCCTHALLPLAFRDSKNPSKSPNTTGPQHNPMSPHSPSSSLSTPSLATEQPRTERYSPLTFSTKCDVCTYPIPPSTTRFHCLQCNAGDYDIDATCYYRLVYNGKISVENGPKGWRRCPQGHRMIIIGFEDSTLGQRRIVVEDLVGGHALKDDVNADGSLEWSWREGQQRQAKTVSKASTGRVTAAMESPANDGTPQLLRRYPPNGGEGMHLLALWGWWPQDGADDELAFPKGAEIRECEDINGDWFWGIYCSRNGVFPAIYGRVVETIGKVS